MGPDWLRMSTSPRRPHPMGRCSSGHLGAALRGKDHTGNHYLHSYRNIGHHILGNLCCHGIIGSDLRLQEIRRLMGCHQIWKGSRLRISQSNGLGQGTPSIIDIHSRGRSQCPHRSIKGTGYQRTYFLASGKEQCEDPTLLHRP